MHVVQRALSAVAVTATVVPLLAGGAAAAAPTAEPRPPVGRDEVVADGILDPVLELLVAPVLSGLGQVGSLLSVSQPTWSLPLVTTDIEWLCDGRTIPGTQGAWTFVPTELHQGCLVVAKVTGRVLGLLPLEVLTNALLIPAAQTPQTPAATQAPVVSGDPKVGKQLTVSAPVWEGDGVATTYQWLRAGSAIPGATGQTYTVVADDVGKALAVQATGTRKDAPATGTTTSNSVTGVIGDAPLATSPASIAGTPEVGGTLTATAPVWSGTGPITTTYQWLRDGTPIAGATASTYPIAPADADHALSVRATGTRPGYQPGSSTSTPVTVAPGAPLTATIRPSISGTPKVGTRLHLLPGSWSPDVADTELGFQWLRDGTPIPGATTDGYLVLPDDAGHGLSAVVTATATGHAPGSATTNTVEVARLASTTTLELARARLPQGKRGKVRVVVRADGASPSGTVTVREGARVVATLTLRADGTTSGLLKRLKPGKHRLTATYAGTSAVAGSTSRPATLTIVKRERR